MKPKGHQYKVISSIDASFTIKSISNSEGIMEENQKYNLTTFRQYLK